MSNRLAWLGLFLAGFLAITVLALPIAHGQEIMGHGVVCDSVDESKELAQNLFTADPQEAVAQINIAHPASNTGSACAMVAGVFVPGAVKETVAIPTGLADIVEVLIIGIYTPQGYVKLQEPSVQYTLLKKPGQGI